MKKLLVASVFLLTTGAFSFVAAQVGVTCGDSGFGPGYCTPEAPSGVASSTPYGIETFRGYFPDTSNPEAPYSECSGLGCIFFGTTYGLPVTPAPQWAAAYTPGYSGSYSSMEYFVQFDANGEPTQAIDWSAITTAIPFTLGTTTDAIAASSSLWGQLSLASTSIACTSSDWIQNDLCAVVSYLFVPSPAVLNNYVYFPALLQTRFPFSWVYGVQAAFEGLNASSTSNFQSATLDLRSLGIGSTTAIGNVLPDVSVLSTTTINTFLPAGMWNTIQSLIAASLWLSLGVYIFFETRNRLHRV